jgi:Cyclic nucleotide-binding domain
MSVDPSEAGEGESEPGTLAEGVAGLPHRNRLELHLHGSLLDIDLFLKSSEPHPAREHDPRARAGENQDRRLAGREHVRLPWWVGRARKTWTSVFHASPPTSEPLVSPDFRLTSRRARRPSITFWATLSSAEQNQFRSRADSRTFAARAHLMREGEAADHVVVILDGQTEVYVDDHGTKRIIARRGPGELIGERAALQVSVRSATVVALGTVRALVMQTEDFADFLSAHPGLLGIVENQVYFRLTEEPPYAVDDDGFRTRESNSGPGEPAIPFRRYQAQAFTGENCTVIYTDVVGFSSALRDDHDRLLIRRELAVMTYFALKAIWPECFWDDRGDGFLVVVPPTVPTAKVLEYLLVALPIALKQHNGNCVPGTSFQLRVALDVGAVTSDDIGVSGQVIINTRRLLDSLALKRAIGGSDVPLGLVVSEVVYQYTVRHARSVTDPAAYKKIRVKAGDISLSARMSLVSSPLQVPRHRASLLAAG